MPELQAVHLFVDLGSSVTKIFYSNTHKLSDLSKSSSTRSAKTTASKTTKATASKTTSIRTGKGFRTRAPKLVEGEMGVLLIPPAVATVSKNRLAEFLSVNPGASPADSAWLKLGVDQDDVDMVALDDAICVGRLAENFRGDSGLTQRKADVGLTRTLAAIGTVREMLGLPTTFSCSLGLALPVMEYRDRQQFHERLQENTSFVFRGELLTVNYSTVSIQPEGIGLIRDRRSLNPVSKIVALMFGYRNLSILVFEGSSLKLEECRSDGTGFVTAVEIAAKSLGLEPETEGLMESVAGNATSLRVKGQLKPVDIREAVQEGRSEYWQRVSSYLKSHLPGGQYDLVYAGGTAWAMQAELQNLLESNGLNAASALDSSVIQELRDWLPSLMKVPTGDLDRLNFLSFQLADPYVGFQVLLEKAAKQSKSQVAV